MDKIILIHPMITSKICDIKLFVREKGSVNFYEDIVNSDHIPDCYSGERRVSKKNTIAILDKVHFDKIKEFNDRSQKLKIKYDSELSLLGQEFKEYIKGLKISEV